MKLQHVIAILMSLCLQPYTHATDGQIIADVIFKTSATFTAASAIAGFCHTKGFYLYTKRLRNFNLSQKYLELADEKFKEEFPVNYDKIEAAINADDNLRGKMKPVERWTDRLARKSESYALDSAECLFLFGSIAGAARIASWWLSK